MGNRSSCCRGSSVNYGYNNTCYNPAYYPSQSFSGYNTNYNNMLPLINSVLPNNSCQATPCCQNCGTCLKCKKCCILTRFYAIFFNFLNSKLKKIKLQLQL